MEREMGSILFGRYRLTRLTYRDSGVERWTAMHLCLGQNVVLEIANNETQARTLREDAEVWSRVTSPHVLQVRDASNEHGVTYVVWEFTNGPSLQELQHLTGGMKSTDRVVRLATQLLSALDQVHASRPHGGLCATSIYIDSDMNVRLGVPRHSTRDLGKRSVTQDLRQVATLIFLLATGLTPPHDRASFEHLLRLHAPLSDVLWDVTTGGCASARAFAERLSQLSPVRSA